MQWIRLATVLALGTAAGACEFRGRTPEEQAIVDARRQADELIGEAEWRIEQAARNPDSVEFMDSRVGSGSYSGMKVVCGSFNGENGFGGMTGFRRYIMLDGKVPLVDGPGATGEVFNQAWAEGGC